MSDARSTGGSPAEAWVRERDSGVRIIMAEMAENAARANLLWTRALGAIADPDRALTELVDLQILLDTPLRIEVEDLLAVVNEACARLDRELPGGAEDEHPGTL